MARNVPVRTTSDPDPSADSRPRRAHLSASTLDLHGFLPYQLTFSVGIVSRVLTTEIRRQFGLNAAEWRVLNIVGSFAPLSTRSVASYSSMEKAKISRATTKLTARGLVTHSVDPADKRLVRLGLSERGKRLHARMSRVAREFEAALRDELSPGERTMLPKALAKLQAAAREFETRRASRTSSVAKNQRA